VARARVLPRFPKGHLLKLGKAERNTPRSVEQKNKKWKVKKTRIENLKLKPETLTEIENAIAKTLSVGDANEITVKLTSVLYQVFADGCLNDVENNKVITE
jgi:hypothetical protein